MVGGCCRDGRMMAEMYIQDPMALSRPQPEWCHLMSPAAMDWRTNCCLVLTVRAGIRCKHCQKADREGQARTTEPAFTQSWTHVVRPPVFYMAPWEGMLLQHPQRGSHRDCANVGMTEGLENSQVSALVNTFHPGGSSPWVVEDSRTKGAIHHGVI